MEESIRAYARLRLDRAREDLATARENLANGRYRAAVNRLTMRFFISPQPRCLVNQLNELNIRELNQPLANF